MFGQSKEKMMTVKELIEKLKQLPQDYEVLGDLSDGGYPVESVKVYDEAREVELKTE